VSAHPLNFLPTLNACLNATAALLLILGFVLIKRGNRRAHGAVMIAATAVSAVFLAGYLTYHFAVVPELGHTPYNGEGALRVAYYGMLITHVVLAAVNLPLVILTLLHAWKQRWEKHRRLARITWPIWLYVSVTGVLVYLVLYRWNPALAEVC